MFQIDLKSRKALYDQIIDNLKNLVDVGVLKKGESILSIRDMAKALTVNPNIVKRAYFELDTQGYLTTEKGRDWFISSPGDTSSRSEDDNIAGLYGRIHADLRELLGRGQQPVDIERLLGIGESVYIQIENLTKHFDKIRALDKLNMGIKKGSIYGLVGTNGSGKTTVIKHIAGILEQDEGYVRIGNIPAGDALQNLVVGYMSEDFYFMPGYNMKMMRTFFRNKYKKTWDDKRYDELTALFGLDDARVLSSFSHGMQKQAGFIFAICSTPDILLLDETIDGIDPIVRNYVFQQIIGDVADRRMTVLITSHNIRELDGICDTIGMINAGRMVLQRDLDDMKADIHKIHVVFSRDSLTNNYPYDELDVLHMKEVGSTDMLVVRGKEEEIKAHINKYSPLAFKLMPITLEEIFAYEREVGDDD